jgi:tetratricopeptide (TPR) repeat protein
VKTLDRVRCTACRAAVCALALATTISAACQEPADPLGEARSLLSEGRVAQAEANLRSVLDTNATSADAHFLLGYALFKEHKPKDSLAEYTAGARYRQPHAQEFRVIASDYVILNDFSDADKWFSQVVAEEPNDVETWYLLGRTKFNENIYADAIASFDKAISLRPRFVEAENNAGLCWKELNNIAKAREAFETAIAWQGETPTDAQPFLNLGTLLADGGDDQKAFPYLEKAVALAPDNPSVHEELGKVQMARQHLPEAQAELERAIALSPDTSSLHFKLAQILRKEGQTERAQREFELCSKLNSTHSSSKTPNPPSAKIPQ